MNIAIDARSLFDAKVRRGIFAPAVKHLHTDVREERLQEGLGLTYEIFAAHAARGVVLDDALLVHSVRLRAQDLGRCVVRAGGPQRKRDVLDIRNYLSGNLEVLQLDEECPALVREAQRDGEGADDWIVSALDLENWLSSLPPRDRELLSLRFEGRTKADPILSAPREIRPREGTGGATGRHFPGKP